MQTEQTEQIALLDRYFWNEHTTLLVALVPDIEEKFPEVWRWFEIKDHEVVLMFQTGGACIFELEEHFWLGLPRYRDIHEYVNCFI